MWKTIELEVSSQELFKFFLKTCLYLDVSKIIYIYETEKYADEKLKYLTVLSKNIFRIFQVCMSILNWSIKRGSIEKYFETCVANEKIWSPNIFVSASSRKKDQIECT